MIKHSKNRTKNRIESACETPWSMSSDEVLAALTVDPEQGLSHQEVARRLNEFGYNELRTKKRRPLWEIFFDQFKSIVILLLIAVGVLAIVFQDYIEGVAILFVVAINALIGFITEWRAIRSMEALKRLGSVDSVVVREGIPRDLPAQQLVPGDIVVLEGGDVITADMRLIQSSKLQADESTLTGESLPVSKSIEALPADARLMDRTNMLFKGSAITRGSAKAVVVATGINTELGHISELAGNAETQQTPLEKRLDALAGRLVWVVLLLALLVAVAGLITGRETWLAIEVAIVLAVSAIPEGLPIVATIALARGMWRMARRNALISKLSAVETLGATSVILTDKTGTLTENRMSVTAMLVDSGEFTLNQTDSQPQSATIEQLLNYATLCSNASVSTDKSGQTESVGDPTEVALLMAAQKYGIHRDRLLEQMPELQEYAFDPESKLMATVHRQQEKYLIAIKGAPESLIPLCEKILGDDRENGIGPEIREAWLERAHELGARGLRTLAIARKICSSADDDPFEQLTLVGIVGLEDPPRAGVQEAISLCRSAGIEVVMVTGDHGATASNIGSKLGIVDSNSGPEVFVDGGDLAESWDDDTDRHLLAARIFSRVTPEQKLRLIDLYQRQGHVVAMTGDGVNDAPALKKADIGVAMGIRGTDVAKEAADMVLQDDEFGTIVAAVAHGRAIFENIRKFVVYLLSCNISEIIAITATTLVGAPLPLLPLQILFLNLVTDVFPALALGVGKGSPHLMDNKPRPREEDILTRVHWMRIIIYGAMIAAIVLAAMAIAVYYLGFDKERAVTVSFCTLTLTQLWHVFNMRGNMGQFINNEISRNPWIWLAVVICIALILAAVYVPGLANILELKDPGIEGWLLIVPMSMLSFILAPLLRVK